MSDKHTELETQPYSSMMVAIAYGLKNFSEYAGSNITLYGWAISTPAECTSYTTLSESSRYWINTGGSECDNHLTHTWYRFSGAAGIMMATRCIPRNRCNSQMSGWISGSNPSVADGKVTRTACMHSSSGCCTHYYSSVEIRNCSGFYVYNLPPTSTCNSRYCGVNIECYYKTTDGKCCSIPFTYGGVKYHSCTTVNHHTLWCSLDSTYKGNWENCVIGS
ncbi:hypothetical protein pdam_00012356 [Pocillopora damicornis]|uniref:Fibronectin type-II domain-containing protein n=1 Tax=Pocillopora damicornis TaxID=46731 RepID=A0A3M6U2K7_POCDA|nr:hypothetical protein pdam_00012356 [Pocillopora damicornis]